MIFHNQLSAAKATERETWSVSGNGPVCYRSSLVVGDMARWKSRGRKCHTPPCPAEWAVDGRHEPVRISCNKDGDLARVGAKIAGSGWKEIKFLKIFLLLRGSVLSCAGGVFLYWWLLCQRTDLNLFSDCSIQMFLYTNKTVFRPKKKKKTRGAFKREGSHSKQLRLKKKKDGL